MLFFAILWCLFCGVATFMLADVVHILWAELHITSIMFFVAACFFAYKVKEAVKETLGCEN
jgi:uncharacterized membrane protein